jgi:hypothetical protein
MTLGFHKLRVGVEIGVVTIAVQSFDSGFVTISASSCEVEAAKSAP